MMKGVHATFVLTGLCYFGVSIAGFFTFGNAVPDNILLAFDDGAGRWVVAAANLMVVAHVSAAFQICAQPVFQLAEAAISHRTGRKTVLPMPVRAALRAAYVVAVTITAIVMPFFGPLMGIIGAASITPTTFLLPPLLWLIYTKPPRWSRSWLVNWALVWVSGAIGVVGVTGALYELVRGWSSSSYQLGGGGS